MSASLNVFRLVLNTSPSLQNTDILLYIHLYKHLDKYSEELY